MIFLQALQVASGIVLGVLLPFVLLRLLEILSDCAGSLRDRLAMRRKEQRQSLPIDELRVKSILADNAIWVQLYRKGELLYEGDIQDDLKKAHRTND